MRFISHTLVILFLFAVACVTSPSGKKSIIITSEAEEAALGAKAYREILDKAHTNEGRMYTILQRVGMRIAAVARKPQYNWEFTLIESKEKNAFALPGGKVAFYTGILPYCENEAGVATVMGHEVAHATARHAGQRITTAFGLELTLAGLNAALGGKEGNQKKKLIMAAMGVGAQLGVLLPFSRSQESEADQIGLTYMAQAGYDPSEAPRFWARFAQAGGEVPIFLSTHPSSKSRQAALSAHLPEALEAYKTSPQHGLGAKVH